MVGILLLLQAGAATACTPALCRLLEQAVTATRRGAVAGYRASVETEIAIRGKREDRMEAATLLEQRSGLVRWSGASGLEYHLLGSRNVTNAPPLSRLAILRIGWLIPSLSGSRLQVIARTGRATRAENSRPELAPAEVVSPLGEDREQYYRYEGGELTRKAIAGAERQVLAVEVIPRADLSGEVTIFEGELDLDPQSHALVRLFGRFRTIGRPKHLLSLPHFEPANTRVELTNQQTPDGTWVPLAQRYEIQTASSLTSGYGATRRVITRFYGVAPLPAAGTPPAAAPAGMPYSATSAPRDSLRHFRQWAFPLGHATDSVTNADFSRYFPNRLRTTGGPLLLVQGLEHGEFYRYNRIEGLFTGLATVLRLRDAAPGVFLHAGGGYAWKEKTARGGADLGWQSSGWTVDGHAARALEITNDFRNQFDNPSFAAVVARDPWDYVERQRAGLSLTRVLDAWQGSMIRVEADRVEDRAVERNLTKTLSGKRLRLNRGITPGTYWRGRASFEWNPEVSPTFAHDGVGFLASVEQASGDLDYTRIEGRIVVRRRLAPFFFLARLHGGLLLGDTPPPQQLFELGDPSGLQGYRYKEFAGTRAALFRVRLTAPLGLFNRPLRLSSGLILPAFSPALAFGFQSGMADTRSAGGLAAVRALGDRYDDKTGELQTDANGDPLPASVAGQKLHSAVDVRLGLFGDALAIGVAHALESGRKFKLLVAFGRQF